MYIQRTEGIGATEGLARSHHNDMAEPNLELERTTTYTAYERSDGLDHSVIL